jgi:non-ribosomal peptide synthetase component F
VGTESIQRLFEHQVTSRGERTAILSQGDVVSYRDLNHQANAVARHLIASGFRRGSHAVVRMPRGVDLAVVLLAILKGGGSYTWFDPASSPDGYPSAVSIRVGRLANEDRFVGVDLARVLADRAHANPNLPIVTRGSDIACVLPDTDGSPAVLVPHGTIASLVERQMPQASRWTGEAGALDLWLGLMSGATVTVDDQSSQVAAA